MSYYARNLPHWQPEGASIFLTWCLHGSHGAIRRRERLEASKPFAEIDRQLDEARIGPVWLKNPAVAECVEQALYFGEQKLQLYSLTAHCIMPNHVHAVVLPKVPLARLTKPIKGFTARTANEILGRTGERFWQDESYDRWIRGGQELHKIIAYVEKNPVMAGLVATIDEWPWSSASARSRHRQECSC